MATQVSSFAVADVAPASTPLPDMPLLDSLRQEAGRLFRCGPESARVVSAGDQGNVLLQAIYRAFCEHRPLVLSPDTIWLVIANGFASHVRTHAEALRHRFVQHQGRIALSARSDTNVTHTPWAQVIEDLCQQIRAHVGDETWHLLTADFSTTGPIERCASAIVFMDVVQSYFDFEVKCICGIPSVTLEGTTADWQAIRDRVRHLGSFDLAWWTDPLDATLAQFVRASQGDVDRSFWHDMYQRHDPMGGYGGPKERFTGWIAGLFPYTHHGPNPFLSPPFAAVGLAMFPPVMSRVPVRWRGPGERTEDLLFVAGLLGVTQDPTTLALRPLPAWLVLEDRRPGLG